ncbi:MAG TPA: S8 family serine peptidase [Blastocatellia bacterium]|nr:S8 family serine peptidase [Blastocatellia bacterium]
MIRRLMFPIFAIVLWLSTGAMGTQAATLSPTLQNRLANATGSTSLGVVIISFNTNSGLTDSHLNVLRGVGILKGLKLSKLGMVAAPATVAQVRALASNAAVRSVWSNDRLFYYMNQARVLTGVDRLRTENQFIQANGGLPVSGAGNFAVVVNDSGIDATHGDLQFGSKVIENVQILTDTATLVGFTPLLAINGIPNTDTHVGHGTHCAGILGGTGLRSNGVHAGVAPGVKLIGTGSGAGLFILNALGGYEWSLANQFQHNIRIISNSWGSGGPFDPNDPVNIATRVAYERNIISVFAAGNSGPGPDTHNPYGKAPWVISVAAGTKEGGLASFSSRGTPREERLTDNDPLNDNDAPTITAPGTGREFESNAARFSAAIVSTRSSSNVVANGLTDDTELPVALLPFYTQISGTSMACPFVAGVVALMLDADPTLTPDQVKQIIQQTASHMPGREDYEVGAGYINAYAAVDKVFNRSKSYGAPIAPEFNTDIAIQYQPTATNFSIDFTPQAPGPNSTNTFRFTVEPGIGLLNVRIDFGTNVVTDEVGNSMGLQLYPPGCTELECGYNSGLTLPALDSPRRQIIVRNPPPGEWVAEVRGLRGLTLTAAGVALPTSPFGIAVPERVDGIIKKAVITVEEPSDIAGHPAEQQIRAALESRMMDTFPDNTFQPNEFVSRSDFALLLALNTPLRQWLGATPRFNDVSGSLAAMAEAVTANGSTLRDWDFTPQGMLGASGSTFDPTGKLNRVELAVALIRALGLDSEARAMAGSQVTVIYNGQTLVLTDNDDIPAASRGYVQLALDRGILQAFFSLEQGPFDTQPTLKARVLPGEAVDRAWAAYALANFKSRFVAGN